MFSSSEPHKNTFIGHILFLFFFYSFVSGQKIFIRFPNDYDQSLSLNALVVTSSALQGALKYIVDRRDLIVYGFYDFYAVKQTIDIDIWGVINPNRVNNVRTNYFGIGILNDINNIPSSLLEATFNIPGIVPLLAPGYQTIFLIKLRKF